MRKLSAVAFAVYAYLMVVAPDFIVFLFTPRYKEAYTIFMINLTLIPFSTLLLDPMMRAYSEYRYTLLRIRIALFVVLFFALWWATARFGPVGSISVVVVIGLLERVWMTALFARVLRFRREHLVYFRDIIKLAASAAAAAAASALVRSLLQGSKPVVILAVCGVVFVMAYAACVYLLGALRDEIDLVWQIVATRFLRKGERPLGA
jgi:hypothetical protein